MVVPVRLIWGPAIMACRSSDGNTPALGEEAQLADVDHDAGAEKRPASQLVALRALEAVHSRRRRLYVYISGLLNNENTTRPYI